MGNYNTLQNRLTLLPEFFPVQYIRKSPPGSLLISFFIEYIRQERTL